MSIFVSVFTTQILQGQQKVCIKEENQLEDVAVLYHSDVTTQYFRVLLLVACSKIVYESYLYIYVFI